MEKLRFLKYGLTALMMAFAMTLCYSCSSDDDEENNREVNPPSNKAGEINGHAYVELAGLKWATENVGQVNGVEAKTGPGANNNEWGCYLYTQDNAKKAAESWGGTWKLPTENQWKALINECKWTMKKGYSYGGKTMNGYIVSDKDDASKFIFLPAAGRCDPLLDRSDAKSQGSSGYYWSSYRDLHLYYDCYNYYNGRPGMQSMGSDHGMAVRPVSK